MAITVHDRQQRYLKRLLMVVPAAAALLGLLFLSFGDVTIEEFERYVGFEGAFELVPEITIVPDRVTRVGESGADAVPEDPGYNIIPVSDESLFELEIDQDVIPKEVAPAVREREVLEIETVPQRRQIPYSEDYVLLHMVEPEYPSEMRRYGIEGSVLVELYVNERGEVEDATILSSVGSKQFEDASLAVVYEFLFKPRIENGQPQDMRIKFMIKFRIYG